MSDPVIHGHILSQPTRSVLAFLKLSNIPFTFNHIDVPKGAHLTPEYTQINPYQTVPALTYEGFHLWESAALIPYLTTTFNVDNQWYPKDLKQRARIDAYFHWHHQNVRQPIAILQFRKVIGPKLFGIPELTEEQEAPLRVKFVEALENIKWVLSDTGYIARSTGLTIADVFAANEIANAMRVFNIEEYPEVGRWFREIVAISEVKELLDQVREVFEKMDKGDS